MGNLIGNALDSLVRQTCRDFETIIIDNYSNDNTYDVISNYTDKLNIKTKKIHNEGNLSKSRNLGISIACGDWLAFLDADDYWEKNKVETLIDLIHKLPSNVVAISHKCYIKNIYSSYRKLINVKPSSEDQYKNLLIGSNPYALSGTIIKKDILNKIGNFSENENFKTVEDYELWIRISQHGRILFFDEPLATIVLHEGNYSKKIVLQMSALDKMKKFYLMNDTILSFSERKRAYQHLYEHEMRIFQKNGLFNEAKKKYIEAQKKHINSFKMFVIFILSIMRIKR